MSNNPVASKRRELVNASVTATIQLPAFPTGPNATGHLVFPGDMKGADIALISWIVTSFTGLTSIDGKLQHSADGVIWEDVDATNLAFAQATANTNESLDVPTEQGMNRFLRMAFTEVGTGSATVVVNAAYCQPKPYGHMAPPGQHDVNH